MQQKEKKYFAEQSAGGGNFDSADFAIGQHEWINMENCRTGSTDAGVTGTVESIGSTILKSVPMPSLVFIRLGMAVDVPNNRACSFLCDKTGGGNHKIMCYSATDDFEYTVLYSSQVIGGLGFNKDFLIHSARIINGVLYWTDFNNEPRRIDIDAGIKLNHPSYSTTAAAYTSPLSQSVLTVIRNPAAYPWTWVKSLDVGFTSNFIKKVAMQFYSRNVYRAGEESVLGPLSTTANYNIDGVTAPASYNKVQVSLPFAEVIDQDVQRVELCVKFLDQNKSYIIKTWDKAIAADGTAIANHNSGSSQLSYSFYNNQAMVAIDKDTAAKPYDTVPIKSKTLELADNRLMLGYNTLGYDTPKLSSLSSLVSSITIGAAEVLPVTKVNLQYRSGSIYISLVTYIVNSTSASPNGYYKLIFNTHQSFSTSGYPAYPTIEAVPATITVSDIAYLGVTLTDVQNSLAGGSVTVDFFGTTVTGSTTTLTASIDLSKCQKTDSTKQIGIVFYDKAMRRCGVFTSQSLVVKIPDRNYNFTTIYTAISWFLSGSAAASEIPSWAFYYQIVTTKALNVLSFEVAVSNEVRYVTKDTSGNLVYNTTSTGGEIATAISADYLNSYGFGYSFTEGDQIKVYDASVNIYTAAVIGQVGKYIHFAFTNMGSTAGQIYIFQVWSPTAQFAEPIFYEVGQLYSVLNPTLASRNYSTLSGSIPGDVYVASRTHASVVYRTERMSPNDAIWQNWNTDAGRENLIDRIGQRTKKTSVKWSNIFISGSNNNGLSTFDALDEKLLSLSMGGISKLQIAAKVEDDIGIVMLAIGEKETASVYIGEVQLYGTNQSSSLAQAPSVIGTVNILKGSRGTKNPESVTEYRGNVYWYDALNAKIVQYSNSGLFDISSYKMTRFWKQFSDQYNSMTGAQIEAVAGYRPFVFMCVDPHHDELLVSIPRLLTNPPKGFLPDYPGTVYPFDIWDGQGGTLVYDLKANPNHWIGKMTFVSEGYFSLGSKLYSFNSGNLYLHNDTSSYCNFYGVQYKSRIMFVANQLPDVVKVYNNISVEANMIPSLTYFRSESPHQQASDILDYEYTNREGIYYATIFRDKLEPTFTAYTTTAIKTGDKIRTHALRVLLEFTVGQTPLELRFVTIGYIASVGHTNYKA